jgi:TonB family protein
MLSGAGLGPASAQQAIVGDAPVRRLTAEDLARYYPDRARRMRVSGWARVRCVPNDKGALLDCVVVGEAPADFGFGDAVLKVARLTRIRPEAQVSLAGEPVYFVHVFRRSRGVGLDADPVRPPPRGMIENARPDAAERVGMATVKCAVAVASPNALSDCVVLAQAPAGQGFGAAAIDLAQRGYRADVETPAEVEVWFSSQGDKVVEGRHWVGGAQAAGVSLSLVPTARARDGSKLPPDRATLRCRWEPDGRLQRCRSVAASNRPLRRSAVAKVIDFMPNLRLTREVTFNINWGQ